MKVLPKEFFDRTAVVVARDLIGKTLVRKIDGKIVRFKIIETEAYEGLEDKASHASRGKTTRNKVMFEEAGTIYIYFTYGMHYMLNIVCGPKDHPSAVLVRGIEGCIGPGRLTKKLGIDKNLNNQKLSRKVGLWFELTPANQEKIKIKKTPRIGVDYAGLVWSKKLYRFVIK